MNRLGWLWGLKIKVSGGRQENWKNKIRTLTRKKHISLLFEQWETLRNINLIRIFKLSLELAFGRENGLVCVGSFNSKINFWQFFRYHLPVTKVWNLDILRIIFEKNILLIIEKKHLVKMTCQLVKSLALLPPPPKKTVWLVTILGLSHSVICIAFLLLIHFTFIGVCVSWFNNNQKSC